MTPKLVALASAILFALLAVPSAAATPPGCSNIVSYGDRGVCGYTSTGPWPAVTNDGEACVFTLCPWVGEEGSSPVYCIFIHMGPHMAPQCVPWVAL